MFVTSCNAYRRNNIVIFGYKQNTILIYGRVFYKQLHLSLDLYLVIMIIIGYYTYN